TTSAWDWENINYDVAPMAEIFSYRPSPLSS
ncbi:unnamed protein product, partial [marine sediment metagenome]